MMKDRRKSKSPTFGPVTPTVGPGEPYFLLRAQDKCSIRAIQSYACELRDQAERLKQVKEPVWDTIEQLLSLARDVDAMVAYFQAWQGNHSELVKYPD